jgi:hypothetical protein
MPVLLARKLNRRFSNGIGALPTMGSLPTPFFAPPRDAGMVCCCTAVQLHLGPVQVLEIQLRVGFTRAYMNYIKYIQQ